MEDRRLLYFFVISLVILLGWQWLMPKPPAAAPKPAAAATAVVAPSAAPSGAHAAPPRPATASPAPVALPAGPPVAALAEQRVVLEDADSRAVFTNRGAQLVSFVLKEHKDEQGRALDLVRGRQQGPWPLGLVGADGAALPLDQALFTAQPGRDADGHAELRFEYRGPAGYERKVVRMLGPSLLGLEVEASPPGWGMVLGPGLRNPTGEELESKRQVRQVVYHAGGKLETILAPKVETEVKLGIADLTWVGLEDNYFLTVLVPTKPVAAVEVQPVAVASSGSSYRLTPFRDQNALAPTDRELPRDLRVVVRPQGQRLEATAYLGAKQYARLARLPWGLDETLQWGRFGFISRPLLWALLWIHDRVPNYGWAIVLLTLGLRILLLPLTLWGQKSMQKMQDLQPRMQAIRQRYRGKLRDKQGRMDLEAQRKMNEEIQELFRAEGANPYGGCMPMLIQIPVFFGLFSMLRSAVELRGAPWLGWIYDLSLSFHEVHGVPAVGYFLLLVVMGGTQVYQQQLTPMSGDPMQRRLMQLFPWVFTVMSFSFPAGLVLYWTVNNLITIAQTVLLKRHKDAARVDEKVVRQSKRAAARAAREGRS